MPHQLTSYRIFIASPGGLSEERTIFYNLVTHFNDVNAYDRNIHFKAVGWQETLPGYGRPQELINKDLQQCDLFILVLHDRWGSPPANGGKYTSGTEEEFHVALAALNDTNLPMDEMILVFKDVSQAQLADPGAQLSQVLAFKKEREEKKDFLYKTFNTNDEFEKILQGCFFKWIRKHELNGSIKEKNEHRDLIESVNTKFELGKNNWLNEIISNDNWELALVNADNYYKQGKIVEADMLYSQIYLRSNDPKHIAQYGKYLRKQFRLFNAEEALRKSISMSESSNNLRCKAYAQRQLGRVFEFKGEIPKALLELQKAFDIYLTINDQNGTARTLLDIGFALSKNNNSEQAIVEVKKAIEIYEDLKDEIGLGASYGYLGVIYKDKGDIEQAEYYSNMALEKYSTSQHVDESEIAIIKGNLGVIKRIKHDYAQSEKLHKEALSFFIKSNDTRAKAREYCNIGVIYRLNNQFDKAIHMHETALELEEQTLNTKGKAIQLANIGLNLMEKNEFNRAEIYLLESLNINLKLGDKKSMAMQYRHIAKLYTHKYDYNNAEINANNALQIDLESNNQIGIAETKKLLAEIYCEIPEKRYLCKDLFLSALITFKKYKYEKLIEEIETSLKQLNSNVNTSPA